MINLHGVSDELKLDCDFYQTTPIVQTPHRINNLKIVVAAIWTNFINTPYWTFECQKGSLTLREHFHEDCTLCEKSQHKVIKIFVDVGKKMAQIERVDHLLGDDPIAVGIELSYEDPSVMQSIRDFLRKHFGDLYLDPVARHSKYYLDPSKHYYDIAFLREGPCEYPIDERLFEEISVEIDSKIGLEKSIKGKKADKSGGKEKMNKKCSKETVKVLDCELKNAKKLYNSRCINWKGKTLDSKEYYTEVISSELLKEEKLVLLEKIEQINRVKYNVDTHDGQHNGDTNRAEEIFAMQLKGKKLEKLGFVIEYQVPLKEKLSDDAGKIDLITYANESVYIVVKYIGNKETLLRAILEIWTYYKQLNKVNFLNSFKLLKQNKTKDIRKAVLLSVGCNAYNEAKELSISKRPKLKQLAKALDVDIFLLEENGTITKV